MNKFTQRIKERREALNMSQDELAKKAGYADRSTIARIEKGERGVKQSKIKALADALGVSPAWLLGFDDENPLPAKNLIPVPGGRKVPIVGTIACGTPILAEENIQGYVDTDPSRKVDFALICKGDSMRPKIQDGDVVLIRSQPTVDNGQTAAVLIDDEATLKKVHLNGDRLILVPENSAYAPLVFTGREMASAHILGLVVGFTRWTAE